MVFVVVGMGIMFIGLGFILNANNAQYLLSGYNTMSKEEQAKFPLELFLKRFKKFHIIFGITYSISGLFFSWLSEDLLGYHLGITPILGYLFFFIQNKELSANLNRYNRSMTYVGIAVLVGVLGLVILLFYWSERSSAISLDRDSIYISGPYGTSISFEEIQSVTQISELPEITRRVHGISTGSVAKGKFRDANGKDYLLLIDKPASDYLKIDVYNDMPIILSLESVDEHWLLTELLVQMKDRKR